MSSLRTVWVKLTSEELAVRFEISKQISDYIGFITRISFLLATWYGAQLVLTSSQNYIRNVRPDNIRLIYEIGLFVSRWALHVFFGVNVLLLTISIIMVTTLAIQGAFSSPDPRQATTLEEYIAYWAAKFFAFLASFVVVGAVISAVFALSLAGGFRSG